MHARKNALLANESNKLGENMIVDTNNNIL